MVRRELVKKILARVYIGLVLLFIYTPIFFLIIFSFTESKILGSWTGFSFKLYADLFTGIHSKAILTSLGNTLLVGLVASLVATMLGSLAAVGIFHSKKAVKKLMNNANHIPIVNAEIVTAVGLLLLFATIGLANHKGFWTVTAAHIAFTAPFVVLSVTPKLKQMNANIYEAALDLGASPMSALIKIVLPELLPSMLSGFLLAFTLSMDDFVISYYTTSSTFQTLSTYIYSTVQGKDTLLPEFRALSTILFLAVLTVLICFNIRSSRKAKRDLKKPNANTPGVK